MPVLGKQRRIRRHNHCIAVQFHATHERRFRKTVDQLCVPRAILAQVHLRAFTIRGVVVVEIVEPPAGRLVGMLVNNGNTGFTCILPTSLIVGATRSRTDRANHNNIRVGGLDLVEDLLEAVLEHVIDKIFVANAQIFKVERFRMTHGGTLGTPFGGCGVAIAEFDQMQHFIDVCRHVFLRDRHRTLAGVLAAHGSGQHR